jgi:hypothetical protein
MQAVCEFQFNAWTRIASVVELNANRPWVISPIVSLARFSTELRLAAGSGTTGRDLSSGALTGRGQLS